MELFQVLKPIQVSIRVFHVLIGVFQVLIEAFHGLIEVFHVFIDAYCSRTSALTRTRILCARAPGMRAPGLSCPPTIKNYEWYFEFSCQVWVLIKAFEVLIEAFHVLIEVF